MIKDHGRCSVYTINRIRTALYLADNELRGKEIQCYYFGSERKKTQLNLGESGFRPQGIKDNLENWAIKFYGQL